MVVFFMEMKMGSCENLMSFQHKKFILFGAYCLIYILKKSLWQSNTL